MLRVAAFSLFAFIALPDVAATRDIAVARATFGKAEAAEEIIAVGRAWARANVGGAGAAYLTIVNRGRVADRLVSVSTPVAKKASLHTSMIRDDVARMRPIKAIEIPPRKSITFKPGGKHIMLMGLAQRLKKGETFPLSLRFERAGTITVSVKVFGIAAKGG